MVYIQLSGQDNNVHSVNMNKKYIYILLAIAAVGGVSYLLTRESKPKIAAPTANAQSGMMEVNAVVISASDFENVIVLSGSIEPNEQVQIRSEVPGIVRSLSFKEGTNVSKGQVLLRIDDTELQAQLRQVQTAEKLAGENANRAKLLLEKEAISAQEFDVASADFESSKAQSALITAQIAKTVIVAPFSGKIGLRNISVGEYLTPTTVVANLMSINPVKILFSVPEKYSGQVRVGQAVRFTVSGSDKTHLAEVYAIEPGVDATTRTINIRALAENREGTLFPGSFARIELALDKIDNAILVPSEAVIPIQNGKQVFLFKDGTASAVTVEAENRTSRDVLVNEGVRIGDTVLISGIMSLRDGSPVSVKIIDKNN